MPSHRCKLKFDFVKPRQNFSTSTSFNVFSNFANIFQILSILRSSVQESGLESSALASGTESGVESSALASGPRSGVGSSAPASARSGARGKAPPCRRRPGGCGPGSRPCLGRK